MKIMCFATGYNSWCRSMKRFRRDGDEFMREMGRATRHWRLQGHTVFNHIYHVKKSKAGLRAETLQIIEQQKDVNVFVFFCHGSWKNLYGAGFNIWNCNKLADEIKAHGSGYVTVILYACGCGAGKRKRWTLAGDSTSHIRGERGFAFMLANQMRSETGRAAGIVIAHTTAGHTTENPYAVETVAEILFVGATQIRSVASNWLQCRDGIINKTLWEKWVKALKHKNDRTFRFDFPFMSRDEIVKRIENGPR